MFYYYAIVFNVRNCNVNPIAVLIVTMSMQLQFSDFVNAFAPTNHPNNFPMTERLYTQGLSYREFPYQLSL